MSCCVPAILSLRAECSKLLCGVALLRLRAAGGSGDRKVPRLEFALRSRSRFGLAALATDITRTGSWRHVSSRQVFFARAAAAVLLLASGGLGIGCAGRSRPRFGPAGPAEMQLARTAWEEALVRSDGLLSAKLLYDARLVQGLLQVPGTLAVSERAGFLEATLAGPFGATVAQYRDGALRGEGIRPLAIEPEDLRSILAGVWRKGTPLVAGFEGGDALLRWESPEEAEAVLDVKGRRLRWLRVSRPEGVLLATYSGEVDPWPERVELADMASGYKLRLKLIANEPSAE